MRRLSRTLLAVAATALTTLACTAATPAVAVDPAYDVLVFSKTAGFRHDSIAAGVQAIRDLGAGNDFTVTATEDAGAFTGTNLARFETVVFLNTTGDVLDAAQQTAFESYIRAGGGYTASAYSEAGLRAHLLGGIRYTAGRTHADCRPETGYTTLYNGSTTGWSQAGPGAFTNSDATLTSTGGLGLYWYSAKQFTDYSLKLDWRLAGDDNSGVFVGFPASTDPWSAVNNGYEIQIDATDAADRTTGSVYTFKAADIAARDAALNPPGEWNTYEIRVEGERLQVFLNSVRINDFTDTDPVRSLAGHIGLQNHGDGDDASFRNVRIKELTGSAGTGPVVGLAGKCLDVSNGGSADGRQIHLWGCHSGANQQWRLP